MRKEALTLPRFDSGFAERLASYMPDWKYEGEDQPQAALLFAAQQLLADTRRRMNRLPEKHEALFLGAFGAEEAPAVPAEAYAMLSAQQGTFVPAGTAFYLGGDGGRLWKTLQGVQAESMTLQAQVLESSAQAREIRLPPPSAQKPARLFDFHAAPACCQVLRVGHPLAFDARQESVARLTLEGAEDAFLDFLAGPEAAVWTMETAGGPALELESPRREEKSLVFRLPSARGVALQATLRPGALPPPSRGCDVTLDCIREGRAYACALCEEDASVQGAFLPFGQDLGLWRCCYLACPDALALPGARVTVRGKVDFLLKEERLPVQEETPVYKPVMRRMPPSPPPVREVWAEQTAWEYWNGALWLPVPGARAAMTCFAGEETRDLEVSFDWPADAVPCTLQEQQQYWLRWRIARTDDTGWLPRRLHIPRVDQLCFDVVLRGAPAAVSLCTGKDRVFVPRTPRSTASFFVPAGRDPDRWWLGFDRPPSADSLTVFLQFAGETEGAALSAWESTPGGLAPLALEDETDGLAHSGLVRVQEIAGRVTCCFGMEGWWLCLQDEGARAKGPVFPVLTGVFPGGVCLESEGTDKAQAGETVLPLRGGPVSGALLTDGFGGVPPETDQEWLNRARRRQHCRDRGISGLDFEQLIRDAFRDVVRTRAHRSGNRMEVAVLLRDLHQHSLAFGRRRQAIDQLLREKTALPLLGLEPAACQPHFYPVRVTVWLRCAPGADRETQREAAQAAVTRFLHPVTGNFRGDGWWFGEMPTRQQVYSWLRNSLPGAEPVQLLLSARTPQGRTVDCAAVSDLLGLPVPDQPVIHLAEKEGVL